MFILHLNLWFYPARLKFPAHICKSLWRGDFTPQTPRKNSMWVITIVASQSTISQDCIRSNTHPHTFGKIFPQTLTGLTCSFLILDSSLYRQKNTPLPQTNKIIFQFLTIYPYIYTYIWVTCYHLCNCLNNKIQCRQMRVRGKAGTKRF